MDSKFNCCCLHWYRDPYSSFDVHSYYICLLQGVPTLDINVYNADKNEDQMINKLSIKFDVLDEPAAVESKAEWIPLKMTTVNGNMMWVYIKYTILTFHWSP